MTEPITVAAATAVPTRGDGTYEVDLLSQYAVGGSKPNGGYLLACLGRAALDAAREAGSAPAELVMTPGTSGASCCYLAAVIDREEFCRPRGPSGNKSAPSPARTANMLDRPGTPRPVTAARASPSRYHRGHRDRITPDKDALSNTYMIT
jgi:hypothetical protein